jgi:hypothetical protein
MCLSRYVRLKVILSKVCVSLSPPKAMLGKVCLITYIVCLVMSA